MINVKKYFKFSRITWVGIIIFGLFTALTFTLNPFYAILTSFGTALILYGYRTDLRKLTCGFRIGLFCIYFCIGVVIASGLFGLSLFAYLKSDSNKSTSSTVQNETVYNSDIDLNNCYDTLLNQETAMNSLLDNNKNGIEDNSTSSTRLIGLSKGINNNIINIQKANDSEYKSALLILASTLKDTSQYYGEYFSSGDEDILTEANSLAETLDKLKSDAESLK